MSSRRVTVVASELLGRPGTGGAGTADSLLAVALGRHGHNVELLIASGREIGNLTPEWTARYESAGVNVRVLERLPGVRPAYLAAPFEVFSALREDPPDIVIANDWRGLAYSALRARQSGLGFERTAFVIHCHGPGRVLTAFAQKVPDTLDRFGEGVAERASVELADTVVSPTQWLLQWMEVHGWPVRESAQVIPYIRQSAALDEPPHRAPDRQPISRLVFFGQLREGKGIGLFLSGLAALEPELLDGMEIVFLGADRGRWTSDRVRSALAPEVAEHAREIRFETRLDREAALAELDHPGTLAVMPSLLDNAPNTVSECIERGIPFVATETGGIPELVADGDRARVLTPPTTDDLAAALRRAITSRPSFAPARPAREPQESLEIWLELVENVDPARRSRARAATSVAVLTKSGESAQRAQKLAERTQSVAVDVVRADSRRDGLFRTRADWVVFLDDDDLPDDGMLDSLVAAQAASGADVVTSAVRPTTDPNAIQLFLGDPGAFGLIENQYGVLGLVRSSLAVAGAIQDAGVDPDWPLFARLALAGATFLSIPETLAEHAGKPGTVADVPGEGLEVLETFEQSSALVKDMTQLAATAAAALARRATERPVEPPASAQHPILRRLATLVRR
jgi:O-antigen biosynthesis protein